MYNILTIIMILSILFTTSLLNSEPVLDFSLPDVNNQSFKLSDHIGEKVIVIDFWASWCAPCMRLLPELDKIDQAHEDVIVIAINVDNPRSVNRAKSLIRSQKYSLITLYDTNQEIMNRFQVTTIPHTLLLNFDGEIVYEHIGYTRGDENELLKEIEQELSKQESEIKQQEIEIIEE
jgi:thiol-disulfide isomerase/thioredoxin